MLTHHAAAIGEEGSELVRVTPEQSSATPVQEGSTDSLWACQDQLLPRIILLSSLRLVG